MKTPLPNLAVDVMASKTLAKDTHIVGVVVQKKRGGGWSLNARNDSPRSAYEKKSLQILWLALFLDVRKALDRVNQ